MEWEIVSDDVTGVSKVCTERMWVRCGWLYRSTAYVQEYRRADPTSAAEPVWVVVSVCTTFTPPEESE